MKTYNQFLREYEEDQHIRTPKPKTVQPKNGHVGREIQNKHPVNTGQRDRHKTTYRGEQLHDKMGNTHNDELETRNNHNELGNKPQ